jgi:RNA polymerase sigma-32 factor
VLEFAAQGGETVTTLQLSQQQSALVLRGPLGSLDQYIQAVSGIPVLSAAEEFELATRLRETDDIEAARRLVLSHLRFVVHIARGYVGYGLQLSDLVQEGNVGLMKAVKRFDPNVGVRLVSFAVHWIRAEIHEFVLKNWRLVKVATTKAQRKLFFNLRKAKKHLGWLSKDETLAVATDLGVSEREVTEMEQRLSGRDVSFDPAPVDDDEYSPVAYLRSPGSDPAEMIEESDWASDKHDRLDVALEKLDARSRDILARRWLTEKKATLHELAAEYDVSAERIRQIEAQAIGKLKGLMSAA